MAKYKIFVIFHERINIDYYDKSIIDHLIFVNVRADNKVNYPDLNIISLYEMHNFISIGKWYTESEVIYNVFKDNFLLNGIDFVGFTHYDIDFGPINDKMLQENFSKFKLINLQPYTLKEDFSQKILMDLKRPNRLRGSGKNCYFSIFEDFNNYYKTDYSLDNYLETAEINLCSSFIVRKDIFDQMMVYISDIIESGKLNNFDTNHRFRIQGGLLERYYAVWFLLKKIHGISIKLNHQFIETNNQTPVLKKIKRKISGLIKKTLKIS